MTGHTVGIVGQSGDSVLFNQKEIDGRSFIDFLLSIFPRKGVPF